MYSAKAMRICYGIQPFSGYTNPKKAQYLRDSFAQMFSDLLPEFL